MRATFRGALALSFALHVLAGAAGLGWMAWRRAREASMDIDLKDSSLLPVLPHLGTPPPPAPPEDWFVGDARRLPPRPVPPPPGPKPTPVPESASATCPPPCPSNPSDWASAGSSVRRPEWLSGMITEDDYPASARDRNVTGLVVVEVLLDEQGAVRDVKLLQGADGALVAKTLEKVRSAKFSPCVDAAGRPFPCAMRLPVDWTLE